MGQQQQMSQQYSLFPALGQGFGYFAGGYGANPYYLGQMPSPTQNAIMGTYQFNPWMPQQQQPQIIHNYYGPSMPGMGYGQGMGGSQMQFNPYQQQNPLPGSFNFGNPWMFDDGRMGQAQFGSFQPMDAGMGMGMGQAPLMNQPSVMPNMNMGPQVMPNQIPQMMM
jgi:hypothetical protein